MARTRNVSSAVASASCSRPSFVPSAKAHLMYTESKKVTLASGRVYTELQEQMKNEVILIEQHNPKNGGAYSKAFPRDFQRWENERSPSSQSELVSG